MSISWKIAKFTPLFVASIAIYLCTLKPTRKSMDISDFLEKKGDLEKFINENFDSVEYDELRGPLLLYRVNFVNKKESLKFCTMSVQQCWVKKIDKLYAFFILIKTSAEVEKHISERYGKWEVKGEISTQDGPIGGDLFSWSAGQVKIDVSSYFNTFRVARYEKCELVICRNMTLSQLIDRSEEELPH
jgi:hypothetical protein